MDVTALREQVLALVEQAWRDRYVEHPAQPSNGWIARVTLPMPSRWPGCRETDLVWYGSAYRMKFELRDAVEEAELWARVDMGPPMRLSLLGTTMAPLRIQGVRPLGAQEVRMLGDAESRGGAEALLVSAASDPEAARLLRSVYQHARANQRDTRRALEFHPDFAAWVGPL